MVGIKMCFQLWKDDKRSLCLDHKTTQLVHGCLQLTHQNQDPVHLSIYSMPTCTWVHRPK